MGLSIKHTDCALVVLCGGRGRRMGGVLKTLLVDAEGRTALSHLEQNLGPRVGRIVLVAPEPRSASLRAASTQPIVFDPGEGPARALQRAARDLAEAWLFVVAGDQPHMRPALLSLLVDRAGPDCDAVVPRLGDRRQPFGALYRREALAALGDVRAMLGLLDRLRVEELVPPDPVADGLRGMNTWDEAKTLGFHTAEPA